MFNLTVLYTRWRFENNTIVEFNIHATKGRAPFNLTRFFTTKLKSRNLRLKIFVKVCLHLSYIARNSFHFDEIFHRKFKIPISTKITLPL